MRPGAVSALRPVGEAMLLWQIIASSNGSRCTSCFASEEQLASLICRSRGALRRRLDSLRQVPGLLLEVKRPRRIIRVPTVFRWATDPFAVGHWYYCITHHRLPALAEEFGLDGDWLLGATKHAAGHCIASKVLADRIKPDLFKPPMSVSGQYGEGKGGSSGATTLKPAGAGMRPRRPRKKNERGVRKKTKTREGSCSWEGTAYVGTPSSYPPVSGTFHQLSCSPNLTISPCHRQRCNQPTDRPMPDSRGWP